MQLVEIAQCPPTGYCQVVSSSHTTLLLLTPLCCTSHHPNICYCDASHAAASHSSLPLLTLLYYVNASDAAALVTPLCFFSLYFAAFEWQWRDACSVNTVRPTQNWESHVVPYQPTAASNHHSLLMHQRQHAPLQTHICASLHNPLKQLSSHD